MSEPTDKDWIDALAEARDARVPAVLCTVLSVRGHAPREAGAKMVVTADAQYGTVGGGGAEAATLRRARELLADDAREPEVAEHRLTDRVTTEFGVQCCGGEVRIVLDPQPVRRSVAVFGLGHVGVELARILARHPVELHLVDTRPGTLAPERVHGLSDGPARVVTHPVAVLPEAEIADLPTGTHVLVMTHDHAEDLAVVDAALRRADLGVVGLIGSTAKWSRFAAALTDLGHGPADLERVTTPIGVEGIASKEPAVIAVAVAAQLMREIHPRGGAPPEPTR